VVVEERRCISFEVRSSKLKDSYLRSSPRKICPEVEPEPERQARTAVDVLDTSLTPAALQKLSRSVADLSKVGEAKVTPSSGGEGKPEKTLLGRLADKTRSRAEKRRRRDQLRRSASRQALASSADDISGGHLGPAAFEEFDDEEDSDDSDDGDDDLMHEEGGDGDVSRRD